MSDKYVSVNKSNHDNENLTKNQSETIKKTSRYPSQKIYLCFKKKCHVYY